ncbi:hypothetical protein SASPL_137196 [Salvia splendens]|uniref:RNase H type-1 domain-containing protein n=1 Tax=Salvia splendens TaxID=180675 RepID=A0A8X8WUI0_SALSN|nr:uncharacterized protein LOC121765654 [Salvia splendens]KAG6400368.1 hypothetical protein SASPL_137196 [Salvia splendens]
MIKAGKLRRKECEGCNNLENFDTTTWIERPRKLIKTVRWIPPDTGWLKLNIKGVWNRAGAGAGGIFRDASSNIVRCFIRKVTAASALDAELQALSLSLEMVTGRGRKVWIESDSKEVISLIQLNKPGPAHLRHQTTFIQNKLKEVVAKYSHCYNVGNNAAEYAAKLGSPENGQQEFDRDTAPAMIKALVRMDQLNMPNFQFLRH